MKQGDAGRLSHGARKDADAPAVSLAAAMEVEAKGGAAFPAFSHVGLQIDR